MIKPSLKVAALAAVGMLSISAARADVQFEQHGRVAYLHSMHLRPGDDEQVRAFLDSPQGQAVRIIYFDSRGGNPEAAMAIGEMIRQRGLDTGFNPHRGNRCVSACTTMFLGGVRRYYTGGERVRDAADSRYGLGFHPGAVYDPQREAAANEYYQRMGAPGASSLRYHIYGRDQLDQPFQGVGARGVREMYFAGSRTAVRAGVATGTRAPAGERD